MNATHRRVLMVIAIPMAPAHLRQALTANSGHVPVAVRNL